MAGFLTAAEAAARLGVTRATLYAYVSRGLIRAHEADDPRQRLYPAEAVERLAIERRRGRRPKEVAKAALDFGAPVLKSAITLIRDGKLWHRGVDAVAFAETAELEDVAALLWELPRAAAFGAPTSSTLASISPAADAEALLKRFAASGEGDATAAWVADPARLAAGCGALVRRMATAAAGAPGDDAPIHTQCAAVWGLDRDGARSVREALNLCADHELNASSFTVRCVASTGASLQAAVVAGLAALSGPRHGGITERVESLFDAAEAEGAQTALRRRSRCRRNPAGLRPSAVSQRRSARRRLARQRRQSDRGGAGERIRTADWPQAHARFRPRRDPSRPAIAARRRLRAIRHRSHRRLDRSRARTAKPGKAHPAARGLCRQGTR